MKSVNASIITIGDELLIGQTIDTNSAFIAQELNTIGVWVRKRVSVGDDWDEIWDALDQEIKESDIIIITGGLGPTADDITKPLLAQYFGGKLVEDEKVLKHIEYLFEHVYNRPMPLLERNRKQAEVPDNCNVLMNERGTAPGMLFKKDNKLIFALPGVPNEMKELVTNEVLKHICSSFELPVIIHQSLLTAGVGESILAEKIKSWEENLPSIMKIAYLPHYGMVKLRLTAKGSDRNTLEKKIEEQFGELKELVNEWLVTDEDLSMHQVIGKMLKERKQTVGTAESCTGGYIAHLLSREPGSSSNYKGTVVSYDNKVKEHLLHVSYEDIEKNGAVSEPVVRQMAEGALKELGSDYVIATSGIMGPDGGSEHKPVGMVWIAVGSSKKIISKEFHFRFDRARNIEQTALTALNMLRKLIIESNK